MTSALVGNIQRYSTEDGPGIRTTVFLKGCPLSCLWCHNPELISPKQGIIFSPSKCISCGYCAEVCHSEAIEMSPEKQGDGKQGDDSEKQRRVPIINRSKCDVCLKCAEVCYSGALAQVATLMSSDEVFETVKRDKSFYDNTGGGLTLSGGEVLTHAAFAEELINLCAGEGINSCIDTSGYGSFEVLDRLASLPSVTDILYDFKALDDDIHQKYIGYSNKNILKNFVSLYEKHGARVKIHARFPLIKGVNDDIEMLTQTAKFFSDGGMSPDATLIPYHNLGVSKARNIGETAAELEAPDDDVLQQIKELFIAHGIQTAILAEE